MLKMDDATLDRLANEPWYVSSRASQKARFAACERLIRQVLPHPGKVIDVGCANGQFSHRLAGFCGQVTGFDINEARINANRTDYAGIHNLSFVADNFLQAELPPSSADLVVALEVLYYFSAAERRLFLQQVERMLRPGGLLLVSANVFFTDLASSEDLQNYLAELGPLEGKEEIYRNWYYRLELPLIRLLDEIRYLEKLRLFAPNILYIKKRFYPGRWNRWLLGSGNWLDRLLLPAVRRTAMGLLESRCLYLLLTGTARLLAPDSTRSQMICIVRKPLRKESEN